MTVAVAVGTAVVKPSLTPTLPINPFAVGPGFTVTVKSCSSEINPPLSFTRTPMTISPAGASAVAIIFNAVPSVMSSFALSTTFVSPTIVSTSPLSSAKL